MSSTYDGPIKNIVVLMLENRSYDNMLGFLYQTSNSPPFQTPPPGQKNLNGLTGTESNPDPNNPDNPITVWSGPVSSLSTVTTIPPADPGELFCDMAQQILGLSTTPSSSDSSPYPASGPLQPSTLGLMGGFIANYENVLASNRTSIQASGVMQCFTPSVVPITANLAYNYAVCDQWFGSAPTQTFANRMFGNCAAPGELLGVSYLNDIDYAFVWEDKGIDISPSIFSQLDKVGPANNKGPNWKIYFHDYSISAKLLSYARACMTSSDNQNLANYNNVDYPPGSSDYPNPLTTPTATFHEDVANGTLPPYSYIEPRYSNTYPNQAPNLSPNSNHPGKANYPATIPQPAGFTNPAIDVSDG